MSWIKKKMQVNIFKDIAFQFANVIDKTLKAKY